MANVRYMTEADLKQVLSWRNHPDVRSMMYTQHEISWEEHCLWFARMQADSQAHLLIYEEEEPLGFVSFRTGENSTEAVWGFYLAPDAPRGSGISMGRRALDFAFSQLAYEAILGEVIEFNHRSSTYHEKLGFLRVGKLNHKHSVDGQAYDVVQYRLTAPRWREQQGIHHD